MTKTLNKTNPVKFTIKNKEFDCSVSVRLDGTPDIRHIFRFLWTVLINAGNTGHKSFMLYTRAINYHGKSDIGDE